MSLERFRLDGETAVITGDGRGIGFSYAGALDESGARLVLIEPVPAGAETAAARLCAKGFTALALQGDVTDPARMTTLADDLKRFGFDLSQIDGKPL